MAPTAASPTTATAANPQARPAVAGEARPGDAGAVGAPVMRGRDLDITMVPTPVRLLVLDADVREVHLVIGLYDTLPISRTYLSASPLFVRSIRSKVNH